ncbi:MAG TPA: hypothetical protein VGP61_01625 [Gemmatimonadales bacterium]|jgi:hypothetical protein|nr:hypothetical protein [Gemmatimonadales bacterium]
MSVAPGEHRESVWLYALAGALMTGTPVWHYLFVNRYPFSRPEAIALPLVAAVLGGALAAGGHRIGGLVESVVFGALLFIFVDLQFDLDKWIPLVILGMGCVALPWILRARRAVLASITLGAFVLVSLPRPAATLASPRAEAAVPLNRTLPTLVHILLDEQWGIGGLLAAGDSATAGFLERFYLQRGFEVYEAAYSRSQLTRQSIPELLALGGPIDVEQLERSRFRLRSNPYFERLRGLGYEIHIYESSHLDYCHATNVSVASCEEVPAVSIANIGYLRGDWTARAVLAGRFFLNLNSGVYARFHKDAGAWRRSFAGRGLAEIEDARAAIAAGRPTGSAYFVHLMLPHRPLEVDADCRMYPDLSQRVFPGEAEHLSDSSWRARLALYGAQVRCVHRAIADLLTTLDDKVGRAGAIVIVHGDHGSRMSQQTPQTPGLSHLSSQQLNSAFSTLLAIRRPRVPPAIHPEAIPIQAFLRELIRNDFKGEVKAEWAHYVHLVSAESKLATADTLRGLAVSGMPWAHPIPPD